jgi:hypothetical protein
MLFNNPHLAPAFILIAFLIALSATSSNAPEIYQIGERVTYVEDGITVTVEPGSLTLYN